jgi:hypothetical protein
MQLIIIIQKNKEGLDLSLPPKRVALEDGDIGDGKCAITSRVGFLCLA